MTDPIAQNRLFQAARTGDNAAIRALVFERVDFDARDDEDRTAFNIATQYGHADTAQTILAARQMKIMQKLGFISETEKTPVKPSVKSPRAA